MAGGNLTLTPAIILGLFFVQRYRFLSIAQFAQAAGLSKRHSEGVLHTFARRGIVSSFGNVPIGPVPPAAVKKRVAEHVTDNRAQGRIKTVYGKLPSALVGVSALFTKGEFA
jgi:hypothetical protein